MQLPCQTEIFLPAARKLYESFPQIPSILSNVNYSIISGFVQTYEDNNNTIFLQAALAYVQIYIELVPDGINHASPEHSAVLRKLFNLLDIRADDLFFNAPLSIPCIVPTANRISSILGRWPASRYNSHKKSDAIQDILTRIHAHQIGHTYYRTISSTNEVTKEFQLVIDDQCAILYDNFRFHIYKFYDYLQNKTSL